jgi:hypothetical protein
MRHVVASLTLALTLAGQAQAGTSYVAQGLFCNTQKQIADAVRNLGEGLSMNQVMAIANAREVACVWADRIGYMITAPILIERLVHDGVRFPIYEASLVGVLVGTNPRPVEPPVRIYFMSLEEPPTSILNMRS